MTKLHGVVELLLARMESHPEEFERGTSRWNWMLEGVLAHCSEEERAALHVGLRPIRLQQLHEDVMDELLNGPDRRANEQNALNSAHNNMGASLRAAISPALQQIDAQRTITLTQKQMSVVNKLTKNFTPADRDKFIRDYAKDIQRMQK